MEWYYVDSARQQHSVDAEGFRELVACGNVTASTLVWNATLPDWIPCSEALPQLFPSGGTGSQPPALSPGDLTRAGGGGALLTSPNAPSTELDPWALCSLVLGIIGLFCCQLLAIPAIICGHIGLNAANEGRCSSASKVVAIVGLVTGYVSILFAVGIFIFYVVAMSSAAATAVP